MLLVHVCCADCLLKLVEAVVPRIEPDRHSLYLFFYNPNIHPEQEHLARQKAVQKTASDLKIPLTVENWTPRDYFSALSSQKNKTVPDKSVRCPICWKLRLEHTAEYASRKGFKAFTTTLLTSRYHNQQEIEGIGNTIAVKYGVSFVTYQVADSCPKTAGFYKQNYEGCVFSLLERMKEKYGGKLA